MFQRKASSAPDTTEQPMSPPKDSSFGPTSSDSTSYRSFTQAPPSEPLHQQHSQSKSSEDFSLPSAPSNPIPPSYSQNSYGGSDSAGYPSHQSSYPHSSGTPFDSLGGDPNPHTTIGSYSYPSDPPGYNSYPPASQDRQDPAQY